MQRISFLILLFLSISTTVFCQIHLDFIPNNKNKKTLVFKPGEYIGYAKKGLTFVKDGELQAINDSAITVNGKTIRIADIRAIGHVKKGALSTQIAAGAVAGFALGYFTFPRNNSGAEKAAGLAIGVPLFAIAQISAFKNKIYIVSRKYSYKVSSD